MSGTFHLSVDDVIHTLIDPSYNSLPDILKKIWEEYNVKTGLYLFLEDSGSTLKEVPNVDDEWLYFGPHSLNDVTPPWQQNRKNQIKTFNEIYEQIDRFSDNRCTSLRLHMYSECYENSEYFLEQGVNELFTTHRDAGLYRFDEEAIKIIKEKGTFVKNNLAFSTTNFRIEELAMDGVTKQEFIDRSNEILERQNRIVIHSHEYEHDQPIVNEMFLNCVKWMIEDLNLTPEQP